ncbi:hypothetical protein PROFUN_03706 [Planoprotostelium fungivorum]|uniref:Uncharacterized protein n=1 Tax=Planoprotostelium fungivorum TaxID=1890364 RepID=A0A2P6NDH1_9EUKA|nr:hypothetical protein PROFUN_03706 [Planoprotostelium fungivorum]
MSASNNNSFPTIKSTAESILFHWVCQREITKNFPPLAEKIQIDETVQVSGYMDYLKTQLKTKQQDHLADREINVQFVSKRQLLYLLRDLKIPSGEQSMLQRVEDGIYQGKQTSDDNMVTKSSSEKEFSSLCGFRKMLQSDDKYNKLLLIHSPESFMKQTIGNTQIKDLQRHKNLCLCLVSHFSDLSRQKIACLGLCLVLPFLSRKTKTSCRANQHYHIPSDVATTTLNTKCEPILNKSHDSMQVVAKMRQWIYFSGTWIEITDCYGGPPLHIRWAQLERESWMKIQWPSYDIPARFEMLQQRTWMAIMCDEVKRDSLRDSLKTRPSLQVLSCAAASEEMLGGPPLHIRWAQLERESWMKIQWPSYDIPARFEMLQQRFFSSLVVM